jgi:glycolate oxidase iron-sulfur subunit
MGNLTKLVEMLKSLEADLALCMRCGMCQSVCPVYQVTRRESDVARGKLIIIGGLLDELFESPNGAAKRLEKCLLCGSCENVCTSGVKCLEIFIKARTIIATYRGLPYWKRLFLRKILASREKFDKFTDILRLSSNIIEKSLKAFEPVFKNRILIPPIGNPCFSPVLQAHRHGTIRVSVFWGCLVEKVFPSVAEATMKVLNAVDADVHIPPDQVCCGAPAISAGDVRAFRLLLIQNINAFSAQSDVIVTPCATCASIIKNVWPVMTEGEDADLQELVRLTAGKVMDITEFIFRYGINKISAVNKRPAGARQKVTFHDPCHLRKSLKIWKEPRQIIRSLDQFEFIEMPAADSCCGFGGSFRLSFPDISEKIGKTKAEYIAHSGADIVATACPGCMMQLNDILSRSGGNVTVKHVIELVSGNLRVCG